MVDFNFRIGSFYRHKGNGEVYEVLGLVLNTTTDKLDVLYRAYSYSFPHDFTRPMDEFCDGRFIYLGQL